MRTYDPADHILYVHLAQDPAVPPAPPPAHDECRRLPAGYANGALRSRIGRPGAVAVRPALVLLPGGAAATDDPTLGASALRLVR
ncbi:hypothetical protein ACI78V_20490 [Geodermatophilus sp. SYSU D00742]